MKTRYLAALSLFVLALVLASCGGSSKTVAEKPVISFSSPVLAGKRVIPASYKCDTRFVWLPLKWGTLPTNTQELALYMVRFGAPKVTAGGASMPRSRPKRWLLVCDRRWMACGPASTLQVR